MMEAGSPLPGGLHARTLPSYAKAGLLLRWV
jgi:hypothetical protein